MTEIVSCPSCSKKLQVPEDFFGKNVQCPECKQTFRAEPAGTAGNASVSASGPAPPAPPPAPPSAPVWEQPPRERRDENQDDRPRRRRHDDDEEDDDRPRRRRLLPHRGGMILAFGIMSLIVLPIVFGPLAWFMGNADLRDMRAGRMDPSGESQTNTGRILGMVAMILQIIGLLIGCVIGAIFFIAIIAGGAAHHHR
jgi:hypothetical protein